MTPIASKGMSTPSSLPTLTIPFGVLSLRLGEKGIETVTNVEAGDKGQVAREQVAAPLPPMMAPKAKVSPWFWLQSLPFSSYPLLELRSLMFPGILFATNSF